MRIMHIMPAMAQGGTETYLVNLMRFLHPKHEQLLMILYDDPRFPNFYAGALGEMDIPVHVLGKRPGKLARIGAGWRYWQIYRGFRPDIVHAAGWHAMDIARAFHTIFRGTTVVVNAQNAVWLSYRLKAEKRMARFSDAIIAISESVADEYREHMPQVVPKLHVIPNGIDFSHFAPQPMPKSQPITALSLARIAPQKNHHQILKAVALLQEQKRWHENWHIKFMGHIQVRGYYAAQQRLIRKANLGAAVSFHPPAHDVRPRLAECDFLLLPSLYEGLGMVVIEAAACARPALISNAVNVNGLMEDGVTGWVADENSAESLAEKLVQAFETAREAKHTMGLAARKKLMPRYDFAATAAAYERLFYELVPYSAGSGSSTATRASKK